jgi:prepilin-type N-terminal cleavage/methylation domain-containing protein
MRQKRVLQSGYSLVELLIVIAIMAVMVVIPVKMLTQNDHRTMLRQHVREVVAELFRIRNVAATLNHPMRLSIDIDEDDPALYAMEVDFFDFALNDWQPDASKAKIELERTYLAEIEDNGAAATFPLLFPFNANGIQLSTSDNSPTLSPRAISFANKKTEGDIITLTLNPLGGIRVTDNFKD